MQMTGATLILLLVSLLAQAPPARPPAGVAEERQAFILGVLRRDGAVLPFASFDGKTWAAPWPADLRYLDVPISLDAVPRKWWGKASAPSEMTIWADGSRRATLQLTRPTTLRIMCTPRLALLTTYKSPDPAPPPMVQPYPKDGLVISTAQPIEPIETVPRTSPEWVPAAVALLEPFDRAEFSAIDAIAGWKHPIPRAERRKVPVELETMYRAPMDSPGWSAYHVEAIKRYRPGPDDGDCGLVTYASGWVIVGPKGRHRIELRARVTYCDRRDNTYMLPLGLIRTSGRVNWVYQLSGYEREGYAVVRPTPKLTEPLVQYSAGYCIR